MLLNLLHTFQQWLKDYFFSFTFLSCYDHNYIIQTFASCLDVSLAHGATIVDNKGNIISFGAIITNEAGSSGGGRGSAAKRLSTYGGYSIKISTDGYIELYIQGNINYSIK